MDKSSSCDFREYLFKIPTSLLTGYRTHSTGENIDSNTSAHFETIAHQSGCTIYSNVTVSHFNELRKCPNGFRSVSRAICF